MTTASVTLRAGLFLLCCGGVACVLVLALLVVEALRRRPPDVTFNAPPVVRLGNRPKPTPPPPKGWQP